MSELKNFKTDRIGIWIPKKELIRLRDNKVDAEELLDDMIHKIDEYEPAPMDPELKEPASELQNRLMQCTIDFLKEKGINKVWSVAWDADSLQASMEEGHWVPSSDSSITFECLTEDGRIPVAFII